MSFNTGLSGLRAAQMDLSVTGNNIANASTKGFKQSRAEFGDVYSASILGTGKNQVGSGVLVERVSQQHTQGNVDYTDRALDMAINGNGFFMVSNNGQIEYTRAGYFDLDKDGYIVNNTGKRLQGYEADTAGNIRGGKPGDMRISQTNVEPKATSKIDIELNLDSRNENLNIWEFDPRDRTTYSDSNQTPVYDSLGIEHVITQYFIKIPSENPNEGNTWAVINSFDGKFYGNNGQPLTIGGATPPEPLTADNWDLTAPLDGNPGGAATLADYITPQPPGSATPPLNDRLAQDDSLVQATLYFKTNGSLEGYKTGLNNANDNSIIPPPANNTLETSFIKLEIPENLLAGAWIGETANSNNEISYNMKGTTQYGATYSALAQTQNGYTTGRLSGIEVDADGTIFARYTNGQNRAVAQVPLATFSNPGGLKPIGSTGWVETSESGIPIINRADSGITGKVVGGALEESNVDLAEELVKMIIGQRNYQANAKTIQTQDTITQTIINLR